MMFTTLRIVTQNLKFQAEVLIDFKYFVELVSMMKMIPKVTFVISVKKDPLSFFFSLEN